MRLLDHPNVVSLKHCFFSTTEKDELYLNLVLEYAPENIHRVIKHYNKLKQRIPLIYVKLYTYQIFRALSYINRGIGVFHRDIKPQNLLVCSCGMSFEDWKIRMEIFLAAYNDNMYRCIIKGPIRVTKTIKVNDQEVIVDKDEEEMSPDEIKLKNLDKVGIFIMTKAQDNERFDYVKHCKTSKEMWDKVRDMSEGNEAIKEHNLSVAMEKFENFKMKPGETIEQMSSRFTKVLNNVLKLGKTFTDKEITLKVLKALPPKFNMKITTMEESRDLGKISLTELFSVLKAYEYKMPRMGIEETSTSGPTAALVAAERTRRSSGKSRGEDSSDEAPVLSKKEYTADDVALLLNGFKKFYKRKMKNKYNNASTSKPTSNSHDIKDDYKSKMMCYNCRKLGHFIKDCPYPKAEKYTEEEKKQRKERREKRYQKNKVLLAEAEKMAAIYSSNTESGTSSDDSVFDETPALLCLMAKESDDSDNEVILSESELELFSSFEQVMNNKVDVVNELAKLKDEMIMLKKQNTKLKSKVERPEESAMYKKLSHECESLRAECEMYKGQIKELEARISLHNKSSVPTSSVASIDKSTEQSTPVVKESLELNRAEKFVSADNSNIILYVQTTKSTSLEVEKKEIQTPKAKKGKKPETEKQTGKTKQQSSPKKSADKSKTNQTSKAKSSVKEQVKSRPKKQRNYNKNAYYGNESYYVQPAYPPYYAAPHYPPHYAAYPAHQPMHAYPAYHASYPAYEPYHHHNDHQYNMPAVYDENEVAHAPAKIAKPKKPKTSTSWVVKGDTNPPGPSQ
ncbi:hypothetical protein RD792_006033 [Penstemon davidsonii]|uniref:Uncharacterized protein n=1 Tax=Penstemon davidsonii TaxID=160366 RepID=A0ABR0DW74_9LAMI|nr:hypothetical protein RD792_006033 [Penstemon davidsonii]